MATKKAATKTTALANNDEALRALAQLGQKVASARAGTGGNFIGTGGGRFKVDGVVLKETSIQVVVSDYILENAYYEPGVAYDPDNPQPPICFAFGRSDEEMVPHEKSTNMQGTPVQDGTDDDLPTDEETGETMPRSCVICHANEWGSGPKGKGKACKNIFRLGVISGDTLVDVDSIKSADDKYIKVPVTSTKAFNKYVTETQDGLHVAIQAQVVTQVEIGPAEKGGHRLDFSVAEDGKIEDAEIVNALIAKHKVIAAKIDFPYLPPDPAEEQTRGRTAAKKGAAKAPAKVSGRVASTPAPSSPAKGATKAAAKGFGGASRAAKY